MMATAPPKLTKDQDDNEEEELDRMALEEIIKETERAKERVKTMGSMGWVKCPLQPTNKRFLQNVLIGTVRSSSRKKTKDFRISEKSSRNVDRPHSNTASKCDTKSPEENRSKHSISFSTEKLPKRNVYSSKDRDKEENHAKKDVLTTNKRGIGTNEKHCTSRKHKLKHRSKHKHKKRKK